MRRLRGPLTDLVRRNRPFPENPSRLSDVGDTIGRLNSPDVVIIVAADHDEAAADTPDRWGTRLHLCPPVAGTETYQAANGGGLLGDVVPMAALNPDRSSHALHPAGRGSWSGDYPTAS